MQSHPKVSVLLPTYNYGEFLDDAIQSVLAQTFTDFELIITDNHSTDRTEEIVRKYLTDPRIVYYKNPSNLGMIPNFNLCLDYSKGHYIKYLMGDDKFHPQMLEKYVAIMEEYPQVSIVTAYREYFGTNSMKAIMKQDYPPFTNLQDGKKVIYASLNTWNWIGEPTTVMFRRSNLNLGKFNPAYGWYPDFDLWIRHLTVGDCYISPEILSYFRLHENQVTVNAKKSFLRYFEEYQFYRNIKDNNENKLDLEKFNLDRILKHKASTCVQVAAKMLPQLSDNKIRPLFFKALEIGRKEKVLFKSLSVLASNFLKKKNKDKKPNR
jgi:glycosyltransferase involved in cell wall biosynthesis